MEKQHMSYAFMRMISFKTWPMLNLFDGGIRCFVMNMHNDWCFLSIIAYFGRWRLITSIYVLFIHSYFV